MNRYVQQMLERYGRRTENERLQEIVKEFRS